MRDVTIRFSLCPHCKVEVREGSLRCFACGTHFLYEHTEEGFVVRETDSFARLPLQGYAKFREGVDRIPTYVAPDDSSTETGLLAENQFVKVVEDAGEFYKLDDGRYVRHRHIEIRVNIATLLKRRGQINAAGAMKSFLKEPTWPTELGRELEVGELIEILETRDNHFRTREGWVMRDYVMLLQRGIVKPSGHGKRFLADPTWPAQMRKMLKVGQPLDIFETRDNHYLTQYGWVMIEYVDARW